MSIFYCPKCDISHDDIDMRQNKVVWTNCRDGWGRAIYHVICPYCDYELAGYMNFEYTEENIKYVKSTISLYSDNSFIDVHKIIEDIRKRML